MVQPGIMQIQTERLKTKRALPISADTRMDDIHPQSRTLTVRLGFYKIGRLQFISHLDLQRFMKRAFVRSGLPIWFSEGFNPHPKMVFSTPLSIGIQSECEFADIKMTAPVTPRMVIDALNPCMPGELQLFYAAPPVYKMTDIGYAAYDIRIRHPRADGSTAAALDAMFASPLTVTKKTKSGDRETDISPLILKTESAYDAENGTLLLHVVLCADNANFLNPEYLLRAAESRLGLCFDDPAAAWYETIRTDLFLADGVTPFQ